MKVAVAQSKPVVGRPQDNWGAIGVAVSRALTEGVDLLVLPELANSGYVGTRCQAREFGDRLPNGPQVRQLTRLIAGSQLVVAVGLCEIDGPHVYDSCLLIDGTGIRVHYRKAHLWGREAEIFDLGDAAYGIAKTRLGTVGVLICFDMWFPETVRLLALAGADIVCIPSNWDLVVDRYYDDDLRVSLAAAQAHMNEIVVVCADRVGSDEGVTFAGRSAICDPRGVVAGPASATEVAWLCTVVNLEVVRSRRLDISGHIASRRPDLYNLSRARMALSQKE